MENGGKDVGNSNGIRNDRVPDHRARNGRAQQYRSILPSAVASVVTVAWAVSFSVDLVSDTYDPPSSVQGLMVLVAGWLFGEAALKRARNGSRK